jgi:hypothetical protein
MTRERAEQGLGPPAPSTSRANRLFGELRKSARNDPRLVFVRQDVDDDDFVEGITGTVDTDPAFGLGADSAVAMASARRARSAAASSPSAR